VVTPLAGQRASAARAEPGQRCIHREEQVTDRQAPPVSDLALGQVVRPIVEHVASLTERAETSQPVVCRIAVKMRRCKHDVRHSILGCLDKVGPPGHPPAAIPPRRRLLVEPPPVRQAADAGKVRPPAALAPAFCALKANLAAQPTPMRRIERPQFATDGHGYGAGASGQNP
jgi:hypothetical protein